MIFYYKIHIICYSERNIIISISAMQYYIIIVFIAHSLIEHSCIIEIKQNAISNKHFLIHLFNCFYSKRMSINPISLYKF